MTFEEILDAGRARSLDFGNDWPSTSRVVYRRIQIREQELFSEASRINPDYFGVTSTGGLVNGEINLKTLESAPGVDPTAAVTRVEVCEGGTSTYVEGDKISVVSHTDIHAEVAPRMTLRNFLLKSVGGDLDGVLKVKVYYGYRPSNRTEPIADGSLSVLPDVYQQLLVLDVTRFLCKLTLSMDANTKTAALGALGEEIAEMHTAFMAEIADYSGAQSSRFGSVVGTQRT